MSSIRALRMTRQARKLERSAKWIVVTVKMAQEWLETLNTHNRPVVASNVLKLVRELRNDYWMVNGETIKFDWNGVLLDGQHRLMAIVESGCPAECLVVYGLDPECFPTLDAGTRRTAGHHVAMLGKSHYNTLGTAITHLRRYERGDLVSTTAADRVVSGPEVVETLARYPDLEQSVDWGRSVGKMLSPSLATFFHYVFSRQDAALADAFFEGLANGTGLADTDAVYHLRERLIRARLDRTATLSARYVMALVIKAWRKTVAGEPTRTLRWGENEEFPAIEVV